MRKRLVVTNIAIKTFGGFALSQKLQKQQVAQHEPAPNYPRAVIGWKDTEELGSYQEAEPIQYGRNGPAFLKF